MATGRAIFQAHVDGLLPESIPVDFQWTFTNTPFALFTIDLIQGDTTIPIPPGGAKVIGIKPPASNVTPIKLQPRPKPLRKSSRKLGRPNWTPMAKRKLS